jgi:hypothetical protein
MPDEIEVPLEHAHEHIAKAHEEMSTGEENTKEGWTRFIAVITALLAVVAAIAALRSGLLVNEALLAKNSEISHRTQASDQWNYYQAKGIKGIIYATNSQLLPPGSAAFTANEAEVARYAAQQAEIKAKAEGLEKEAEVEDKDSEHDMDKHHIFAFSVSLCQVSIALSAVAALTRRRRVWLFGLAAGILGTAALIAGFLGFNLPFAF